MKLIFSTALSVKVFDCDTHSLRRVAGAGSPEYYGISAGPRGIVLSNSCIDNGSLNGHQAYIASPKGHLSVLNPNGRSFSAPELLQPHQIECFGEWILCANSGLNCITLFGPDLSVRHHYPTRARFDILPDGRKANHFNSVHVRDGVVYVVAHNYDNLSAVWLFSWPEFQLIDVVGTNTGWAHNVMKNEDDLLVCNSKAGSVYSVRENRDIWTLPGGGFITRGFAATPEYLFVGLTAVASRGDRRDCDAGICVLDRKSMSLIQRYHFTGIGGIHEVRLLDAADDCHSGAVISSALLMLEDPLSSNFTQSPAGTPVAAGAGATIAE